MNRTAAIMQVLVLLFWLSSAGCATAPEELEMTIAGQRFRLELAVTPEERRKGLMGRERIAEDGGMLFAYRTPRPLHFAMPHCRTPIDLAFLDGAGRVLAAHTMAVEPPQAAGESGRAYDLRLPRYPSRAPAQFVIELRGGRLQELGVDEGDLIELPVTALGRWAR